MVKKKSAENKSTIKQTVEPSIEGVGLPEQSESPQAPQPDPAEQLLKILQLQEERQSKAEQQLVAQGQQVNALTKAITNIAQAMDVKAEEKKANMGPMDYIKMLTDIMNGPIGQIVNKAIEGLSGGGEEAAASVAPPPSQAEIAQMNELRAYRDGRMKEMDQLQSSWMKEMVEGLKLANNMKKREMEAEF